MTRTLFTRLISSPHFVMLTCGAALVLSLLVAPASAQASADQTAEDRYYSSAAEQFNPKVIIRQKAIARAEARAVRTATRAWFGINPARPQATATPLVGVYNGGWGVPGGRPAIFQRPQRPVYIFR